MTNFLILYCLKPSSKQQQKKISYKSILQAAFYGCILCPNICASQLATAAMLLRKTALLNKGNAMFLTWDTTKIHKFYDSLICNRKEVIVLLESRTLSQASLAYRNQSCILWYTWIWTKNIQKHTLYLI